VKDRVRGFDFSSSVHGLTKFGLQSEKLFSVANLCGPWEMCAMYALIVGESLVTWGTELECYQAWQARDDALDCAHLDASVVSLW
jgi:hypothetical protein